MQISGRKKGEKAAWKENISTKVYGNKPRVFMRFCVATYLRKVQIEIPTKSTK